MLTLFGRERLADDAGSSGWRRLPGGDDRTQPGQSRDEVDQVVSEWAAGGAEPIKAPEAVFWGGYSGTSPTPMAISGRSPTTPGSS